MGRDATTPESQRDRLGDQARAGMGRNCEGDRADEQTLRKITKTSPSKISSQVDYAVRRPKRFFWGVFFWGGGDDHLRFMKQVTAQHPRGSGGQSIHQGHTAFGIEMGRKQLLPCCMILNMAIRTNWAGHEIYGAILLIQLICLDGTPNKGPACPSLRALFVIAQTM